MANNNIKMGNVRNSKLESIADIDIRIDIIKGFLTVPVELIPTSLESIPDYSKIVKMEVLLEGYASWYNSDNITEERRQYVLSQITNAVVGNIYAFKVSEDSEKGYKVYAYVTDTSDNAVTSAVIYTEGDTTITLEDYQTYDLNSVNDPEFSYMKFNTSLDDIFTEENKEKLTSNILVVEKDGYFRIPFYYWEFQEMDDSDIEMCTFGIPGDIFYINVEMGFFSDGTYVIIQETGDDH